MAKHDVRLVVVIHGKEIASLSERAAVREVEERVRYLLAKDDHLWMEQVVGEAYQIVERQP